MSCNTYEKDQTNLNGENSNFKGEQIKSEETVYLLGIYRDHNDMKSAENLNIFNTML